MSNIVIAFPKKETAQNIKKILGQSGYNVQYVCTTGAQALSAVNSLEQGIIICGARFVDMMYNEIHEYLPPEFTMLLIASKEAVCDREVENLVSLSLPLKVHELLETLEMMEGQLHRRRKKLRSRPHKRSAEEEALLRRAKGVLMERNGFSEEEAHRYIQKRSMENGTGIIEVSQMILSLMEGG